MNKLILLTQTWNFIGIIIACIILVALFLTFIFFCFAIITTYLKEKERRIKKLIKQSFTYLEEKTVIDPTLKKKLLNFSKELEQEDFFETTQKVLRFLKEQTVKKEDEHSYKKVIQDLEIELDTYEIIQRINFEKQHFKNL